MRLGEVRALQKADIDWQNNTITARDTKSGRDKILAMPVWLRAMLMEIVEENDSPFVFISRHTGKPWIDITWPLQKAAAAAGITKHVHPHLLRHSIASHLTDLGTSIRVIQSFLGHSDIQMSAWYAQVSAANKQGVAGVIDSMTSFPLDK
jgi:site-specific recombinase XerD